MLGKSTESTRLGVISDFRQSGAKSLALTVNHRGAVRRSLPKSAPAERRTQMKAKISLVALATALSIGSAFAADLPSRKAPVYIPPPPAPMWTGFYAGLNAGYGWATDSSVTTASGAAADVWNTSYGYPTRNYPNGVGSTFLGATALANATNTNVNQSGFIGGAQFGYNWQYGSNFVFGIETDIQGAGIRGSGSSVGVSPSSTFTN